MKLGLQAKILLITAALALAGLIAMLAISNWLFGETYLSSLQSRFGVIGVGLLTLLLGPPCSSSPSTISSCGRCGHCFLPWSRRAPIPAT
jgi:hypothetical protein